MDNSLKFNFTTHLDSFKLQAHSQFQNGINAIENYNLNQAARWYEAALTTANEDLSFEIIVKQKELATILLDSALNHLDIIGFNNAEKLIIALINL